MLTFRLIYSCTYLKQADTFTSHLGNNGEKNQISVQISIKGYYTIRSECVSTFCEHSGGLCNLMSIALLNANNFELRLRNRGLNDESGSTM